MVMDSPDRWSAAVLMADKCCMVDSLSNCKGMSPSLVFSSAVTVASHNVETHQCNGHLNEEEAAVSNTIYTSWKGSWHQKWQAQCHLK
jgi:hypothetical protein